MSKVYVQTYGNVDMEEEAFNNVYVDRQKAIDDSLNTAREVAVASDMDTVELDELSDGSVAATIKNESGEDMDWWRVTEVDLIQ